MTAYRPTDAQLAAALCAKLPAAAPGLRTAILDAVEHTPQARMLPGLLGALTDADLVARRRVQLLVAAAFVALTTFLVAAVGAWIESRRLPSDLVIVPNPSPSLTPRPSVFGGTPGDALVLEAYTGLVDLPPFRLEFAYGGQGVAEVYFWDGERVLRHEHRATPSVTNFYVLGAEVRHPMSYLAMQLGIDAWACPTGWRLVDEVEISGRTTHHLRCDVPVNEDVPRELWIDRETGLPLGREDWQDANTVDGFQATTIEIGPQPAELFEPAPLAPSASPNDPVIEPQPAALQGHGPEDVQATLERVRARYSEGELDIRFVPTAVPGISTYRWITNGTGAFLAQTSSADLDRAIIFLWATDGEIYESYPQPDGSMRWRPWGPIPAGESFGVPFSAPAVCSVGWRHLGVDLVLDRPADHIACAHHEFWIDREWLLVTRVHDRDPLLDPKAGVGWVTSVSFEAPAELLEPPPTEARFSPFPG